MLHVAAVFPDSANTLVLIIYTVLRSTTYSATTLERRLAKDSSHRESLHLYKNTAVDEAKGQSQ